MGARSWRIRCSSKGREWGGGEAAARDGGREGKRRHLLERELVFPPVDFVICLGERVPGVRGPLRHGKRWILADIHQNSPRASGGRKGGGGGGEDDMPMQEE